MAPDPARSDPVYRPHALNAAGDGMSKRRLAAGLLVAIALAPGTFFRTHIPQGERAHLEVARLDNVPARDGSGGFSVEGVWELSSGRLDFGGYSAMLPLENGRLRLFSDRGQILTFSPPGEAAWAPAHVAFIGNRGDLSDSPADVESAVRDPATGEYWLGYENPNSVIRYAPTMELVATSRPPHWQDWPANAGAEAMERLPDGRFIVLPEGASTGLLYASDPISDEQPLAFAFSAPGGYSPTDMAALPDGRVLVLLRKVAAGLPPFATAIAIADPGQLQSGDSLDLDLLVRLDDILPSENYEGLALAAVEDDGAVLLWLVSDDNLSVIQRTLLARLVWRETISTDRAHEKAREE
jgi:hypothetical protein